MYLKILKSDDIEPTIITIKFFFFFSWLIPIHIYVNELGIPTFPIIKLLVKLQSKLQSLIIKR